MISIPLVLTDVHPCSYLDDEGSQSIFVHPDFPLTTAIYSQLLERGFRRSGDDVYTPHCPNCSECIAARIPIQQFKPNRSQQRCWRKNQQTQAVIKLDRFDQAHYDLYVLYQRSRHTGGAMADSSPEEYIDFLSSSWCDTIFVEFSINNELAGVAIVDQLDSALSAVYTFFDPKFSAYSLGVYAVLWQIEYAKKQNKDFVYLGFWIPTCRKMAYKINYQPLQILQNQTWKYHTNTSTARD